MREVLVATPPSVDGEATALLLARDLGSLGVQVSRIASGVPHGGYLEFADQVTLGRAIRGPKELLGRLDGPFRWYSGTLMGREAIKTEHAPAAIGPYSQAIAWGASMLEGQIALDPATAEIVKGGIDARAQTRQVMRNLRRCSRRRG